MTATANLMHVLIFHLPFDVRLSAADRIAPVAAFAALTLGGLSLGLMEAFRLRKGIPGPVDPVEANALRGGRMSLRDSFIVGMQTLISNSCGASVGLEAGYTQVGSGLGSFLGQKLRLRRSDLRLLVGAGAAAAIGGSFGAPLTGAFYAFEVVLGSYSIAAAGPIFTASIVGVLVTHFLAGAPYQINTPAVDPLKLSGYPALFGLAACAVAIGVVAMRGAGASERALQSTRTPVWARPVIGGLAVAALATITPQVLGAGHGALGAEHFRPFSACGARGLPRAEAGRLPDFAGQRLSRRPVLRVPVHGRDARQDLRTGDASPCFPPSPRTRPSAFSREWRHSAW